jgi:GH15 family glucan-1,4-alpha-glucosidase
MAAIEDYGFIGNTATAALVGRDGSIDWLCLPRFDSDACFAALLGTPANGRWLIRPEGEVRSSRRRYLPGTPILETTYETAGGIACVTDFMPPAAGDETAELIRIVRAHEGEVRMQMELVLRFGYGRTVPWVRKRDYGFRAIAGPDAVELATNVRLQGEDLKTVAAFTVTPAEKALFTLAYHPSQAEPRFIDDRELALERTRRWWQDWSGRCSLPETVPPAWREAILRSLITLKAMTHDRTGALVAAPTTSLPEEIGGERNWDYRFCWVRDATITLYALVNCGYFSEADAFREWLLRATAGHPEQLQIMYGLAGERRLTEIALPWLPGYEGSGPVRIGNAACEQLQHDVYGELMDALHAARRAHIGAPDAAWPFQRLLLKNLERIWREPDAGIWEVRGPPRHFTYSKAMCWAAFDRGINAVEEFGLDGPAERWRTVRDEIRRDIEANGYDPARNTFVQHYGGRGLDASLLLLGCVGFLAPDDPRFRGTVAAVERELVEDGLVRRYRVEQTDDGVAGDEACFLVCSFWLVDALVLLRRHDDAHRLFERLLTVRNDLGLLAEEYDPRSRRQLGNFPQAFSHVGLITSAINLLSAGGPSRQRAGGEEPPHPSEEPACDEMAGADRD